MTILIVQHWGHQVKNRGVAPALVSLEMEPRALVYINITFNINTLKQEDISELTKPVIREDQKITRNGEI